MSMIQASGRRIKTDWECLEMIVNALFSGFYRRRVPRLIENLDEINF